MGTKSKDGFCRKFAKFLFSHIGLSAMVVLYCVAGGFIFEHLEKNNEEQICFESRSEYTPMETKTINSTMQVFTQYGNVVTDSTKELMEVQIRSILETFRSNTLAIGYDGRDCNAYGQEGGPTYSWSWAGGLMFSVTVVSTIGQCSVCVWGGGGWDRGEGGGLMFSVTVVSTIAQCPVCVGGGRGYGMGGGGCFPSPSFPLSLSALCVCVGGGGEGGREVLGLGRVAHILHHLRLLYRSVLCVGGGGGRRRDFLGLGGGGG